MNSSQIGFFGLVKLWVAFLLKTELDNLKVRRERPNEMCASYNYDGGWVVACNEAIIVGGREYGKHGLSGALFREFKDAYQGKEERPRRWHPKLRKAYDLGVLVRSQEQETSQI